MTYCLRTAMMERTAVIGLNKTHQDVRNLAREIFLLTKPPRNDRTSLCFKLIAGSKDAVLYLAGDGVYNLLNPLLFILHRERIFVCKEEMDARGLLDEGKAKVLVDFYERLVDDVMSDCSRVYAF